MFNAGEVVVQLGGRLNPAGFQAFDAQLKSSASRASFFERSLKSSMTSGQKSLDGFKRAAGTTAKVGLFGLGAALVYTVKKAADFEQQMSRLGAVSNASGRQMEAFKKSAMSAGAATKFSALEAAQAQTELAKGGLSVSQILGGGLKAALALAAAGEMDLADAASTTVNAMKLFGLHGKDAMKVADGFATAANATTADVSDFAMALSQGGSAAKAAGLTFQDTTVALEALASVGIKGSDAGTSLKSMLVQLAAPTDKASKTAQGLGLSFFDAQGKMKSLADISGMLRNKLGDVTNQQRLLIAKNLVGTDGMRALLALYDAGPAKLQKYKQGLNEQGTAAEVARKKQDNLKGALETLGGSVETAAITIGQAFIPMIRDGAENLTDFINKAQASGGIDRFAHGVADAAGDVAAFVPKLVGAIGDIGSAAADVVHFVAPIGGALDDLIPGDLVHNLAGVAAGLAAFKVGSGLVAGIASLASPLGAAKVAAVVLGAAIVGLSDKESGEAQVAREAAEAKRDQADATREAADAIMAAADTGLAAKQAAIDYKQEKAALDKLKPGTQAYLEQQLATRQASLRLHAARDANNKALDEEVAKNDEAVKKAKLARDGMETAAKVLRNFGADKKTVAEADKQLLSLNQQYIQALANQKVAETSRQRLMQQSTAITQENAEGVSQLIQAMDGISGAQQAKLLVDDQDALAKAGGLASKLQGIGKTQTVTKILASSDSAQASVSAFEAVLRGVPDSTVTNILVKAGSAKAQTLAFQALLRGVPEEKVTTILAETSSAKAQVLAFEAIVRGVPISKVTRILANTSGAAEVAALRNAIDSLHDKTVTVYNRVINQSNMPIKGQATGRSAGSAETAMVGEGANPREYVINRRTGQGYVTGGPMVTNLGPDDYVIPTDQSMRGRALGLLGGLMRDLGMSGYAKGRQPRPRYALGGVPFGDVEQAWQDIQQRHKQAEEDAKSKDKPTAARGNKLLHDKKFINHFEQLHVDYKAARRTNEQALGLQSNINVLADQMELADRKGQRGRFRHLRGERVDRIVALQKLLRTALHSPARHQSKRDILEQLSRLGVDLYDTRHDTMTAEDKPEPSPFTKAEQGLIDYFGAMAAVAGTTEGIADDQYWLTGLLNVEQGALQRAIKTGAPPAILKEAAEAVSSTQGALESLTTSSSTPAAADQLEPADSSDVQAQLTQANERLRVATLERDLNAAALTAGLGSSNITINTLHPGDPNTLIAIGRAAVGGISHSQTRTSPRVSSGM